MSLENTGKKKVNKPVNEHKLVRRCTDMTVSARTLFYRKIIIRWANFANFKLIQNLAAVFPTMVIYI